MATSTYDIQMPEQGSIAKVVLENGSFDQCIAQLQKRGIGLWMPKDLALVRMAAGPDHDISTNGSLVNVSYNYDNSGDADILLASGKRNPLIPNAEKATRCHRQGDEFFPSDNEWKALRELAETDPYKAIKSGVLLLHRKDVMDEIPTHAYGEIPETIFIFEDQAKPYGGWLAQQRINSSSQYTVPARQAKKQDNPFSRLLGARPQRWVWPQWRLRPQLQRPGRWGTVRACGAGRPKSFTRNKGS